MLAIRAHGPRPVLLHGSQVLHIRDLNLRSFCQDVLYSFSDDTQFLAQLCVVWIVELGLIRYDLPQIGQAAGTYPGLRERPAASKEESAHL
jgi:hypothetical protein